MNDARAREQPDIRAARETSPPPTARMKGPPVWLDMDQQELDDAYDQLKYAANAAQLAERRAVESAQMRARIGEPQRIAYGPSAIETLDLYRASGSSAPVAIFVHGGAWRARRATEFAIPAELFVRAGAHFVMPDFAGVEEHAGRYRRRGRSGPARRRLRPRKGGKLRWRSRPHLSVRPFIRRASCWRDGDHRLAHARPARRDVQGRAAVERHVRTRRRCVFRNARAMWLSRMQTSHA